MGRGARRVQSAACTTSRARRPCKGVISAADIAAFAWPDPQDPGASWAWPSDARHIREVEHRAVFVGSLCAGVTEMHFRLRGYEDGYMDMAAEPGPGTPADGEGHRAQAGLLGEGPRRARATVIDIAAEADDLGAQHAPLFSPRTYREIVKPLHAEIVSYIKSRSSARFFLHSCGAIRDLIPDLIEIGVDCLEPGPGLGDGHGHGHAEGGVREGHHLLGRHRGPAGDAGAGHAGARSSAETRRRIGDLKPGGGFVFASIHNMQAHVPVENILAMWEALDEAGAYG